MPAHINNEIQFLNIFQTGIQLEQLQTIFPQLLVYNLCNSRFLHLTGYLELPDLRMSVLREHEWENIFIFNGFAITVAKNKTWTNTTVSIRLADPDEIRTKRFFAFDGQYSVCVARRLASDTNNIEFENFPDKICLGDYKEINLPFGNLKIILDRDKPSGQFCSVFNDEHSTIPLFQFTNTNSIGLELLVTSKTLTGAILTTHFLYLISVILLLY